MTTKQLESIRPDQMIPIQFFVQWRLVNKPASIFTKGEISDHMAAWHLGRKGGRK